MVPTSYDPNSPDEQPVALPEAPLVRLSPNAVLQPPRTRRGTGPGMIVILPPSSAVKPSTRAEKPLDPEPVLKCAEEGFAVVGVTPFSEGWSISEAISQGVDALLDLQELDTKDKFAVTVYHPESLPDVLIAIEKDTRIACLVVYGSAPHSSRVPVMAHLPSSAEKAKGTANLSVFTYESASPHFVLPHVDDYVPPFASLAHSRNVPFWRKHLGGPYFDIEAIWEEHTYFEFETRSVAHTMGTMVAEPYVNHVTTMTGGIGRKSLTNFYRDHFIFANPADTRLETVSRTIGADRVVDEFIFHCTHDRVIDWLLPAVPPTGRKLAIPMLGVVNVRGDRLYHEHIWWDQGTAMIQAGIMPSIVPFPLDGDVGR
ncbi:hypothetical protein CPB85DRAFT_1302927 [Mucidula mucida]|nr:hypothetical protein CPB85DRAFT_1302927 [Mucidula mucida]